MRADAYASWLPAWWDALTVFRLLALLVFIAGWAVAAWFFTPVVFDRFSRATAGYVEWMIESFDRMFRQVAARRCVAFILLSMSGGLVVGLWVTSGLPSGTGYSLLRILICWLCIFGIVPLPDPRREQRGVVAGLLFGLPAGYNLPRVIVSWMWRRRLARFEDQMLDALTFMSNGLKSGLSLIQCMDMVREELPDPISQEFAIVLSEQRLGVPLEEALLKLETRIGTEDLQIMVTSVNILRQSGGNLSETFDTLAYTIRERKKVEGRIRSLTAQGISQGVIIVGLPFVLGGVLYLLDPVLISRLWTTAFGIGMLAGMVLLQLVGGLLIKKIVIIEV